MTRTLTANMLGMHDDGHGSRDDVIADDDERMMFLGEKEDRDRHTDAK